MTTQNALRTLLKRMDEYERETIGMDYVDKHKLKHKTYNLKRKSNSITQKEDYVHETCEIIYNDKG